MNLNNRLAVRVWGDSARSRAGGGLKLDGVVLPARVPLCFRPLTSGGLKLVNRFQVVGTHGCFRPFTLKLIEGST
jgi:hypothetical protein